MKYLLIGSILVFILGDAGHDYYVKNIDFMSMSEKQAMTEWLLRLLRDIGIFLAAALSIILSFSKYPSSKNKKIGAGLILLSVAFCVAMIAGSGYMYSSSKEISSALTINPLDKPGFIQKYKQQITSTIKPLPERVRLSKSVASSIYRDSGAIVDVITEDGSLEPYTPSADDTNNRKKLLRAKSIALHTVESLKYASIAWLFILIVSVSIGALMLRRKSRIKQSL